VVYASGGPLRLQEPGFAGAGNVTGCRTPIESNRISSTACAGEPFEVDIAVAITARTEEIFRSRCASGSTEGVVSSWQVCSGAGAQSDRRSDEAGGPDCEVAHAPRISRSGITAANLMAHREQMNAQAEPDVESAAHRQRETPSTTTADGVGQRRVSGTGESESIIPLGATPRAR
jgi:hypothetical protein